MAYEIPGFTLGVLNATEDLSSYQFCFVHLTTDGGVALTTAGAMAESPLGILQNTPTSNQTCEIMVSGVSKMICAAQTSAGDLIIATSAGRGVTWTSGTSSWLVAKVLKGALTTEQATVMVHPAQRVSA
jgi:hypothetical protein